MNRSFTWRLAAPAALVLLAAASLAAGCGGSSSSKSGSTGGGGGGTLVDGTTDSVTNVDPAGNYDYGSATLDAPIFQHLLEAGPGSGPPHPVLATKCEFEGDSLTTYKCELRQGVKFHNGSTMTPADVVWSFNRVNKIKDESGIYTLLSNLKSVQAEGDNAVVFHLKTAQATWPFILTTGAAQIVPKGAYPANKLVSNTSPQYGTGPYQLTKFQPGQQAVLKRFKDYWGKPAKTDSLIIRYYTKSSTMKLALERGDIDMAFQSFTPTELSALQNESGIDVHQGKGSSIRYLVLNVKRPPTNQLAVRQAIAYLMPRDQIAKLYRGTVKPLYSQVPAGLAGHEDVFKTQYGASPNPSKAKSVLQKAGISTPVNLTLWYTPTHYGDTSADEYAEIKRSLESSGVFKVTLQSAEWATYSDALGKTYGAFQLGWFPDYVDAENYLLPFFDSNSNFTSNDYKSASMDSILKNEQGAKEQSSREDLIRQAQTLSAKDVPIIPYWQGAMVAVARDNVNGIDQTLDPTFIMRFWLLSKS